jgi:biopolymer transport protein ExbB
MHMGFKDWFFISPYVISVLILFSILVVTYFLERMWVFRREGKFPRRLWSRMTELVRERRARDAMALCDDTRGVFAKAFKACIQGAASSRADAEDNMLIEKEDGQEFLRKRVGLFGTISFIAPLIGLLGTVLGVLRAFKDLALSGSGGPSIVAAGISEALVTTVAGLCVAIPSAIIYNYFNFRLRAVLVDMNSYGQRLLMMLYEERAER